MGRAALDNGVRLATVAVPVAASVLAGLAVSRALPPAFGLGGLVARFLAVGVVSTVVLAVADRLFRRLLPLAALLKLSLAFPDKAPSRFSVALRAGSTSKLERHAARARSYGPDDDPSEAAGGVLTLAAALNAHDRRTRGHSERVRAFTDLVAEEMGCPRATGSACVGRACSTTWASST